MKRTIAIITAFLLIVMLAACGTVNDTTTTSSDDTATASNQGFGIAFFDGLEDAKIRLLP